MNVKDFGKTLTGIGCLCIALPFIVFVSLPLFVLGVAMIRAAFGG